MLKKWEKMHGMEKMEKWQLILILKLTTNIMGNVGRLE